MRSRVAVPLLLLPLLAACSGSSTPGPTAVASAAPSVAASSVGASPTTSAPPAAQSPVPAENNPPGDIPDNVAFVPYSNASGRYRFTHPEGWAEQVSGGRAMFTDKLNGVTAEPGPATTAPTVDDAKSKDVPALRSSQAAFELRSITAVTLPGGTGVRIVYRRNSAPDAVTGRQYRDEVQRYELVHGGREVVLEMFGPVGADNVDAYRTIVTSLRIA